MPDTKGPRVGEVWTVLFDPVVGHEQGGLRPALVVSNEAYNAVPHGLRIVAPITGTDRNIASHLLILPPEGGLAKPSVIMCEQVAAQSVLRFRGKRGSVSEQTMASVRVLIDMFVDID